MPLRLRTLMIAVGVAATTLALMLHVRAVIRAEDDLAAAILFLEAIAGMVLVGIALTIRAVARLVRSDAEYAAQLRRRDASTRRPFPLAEPGPAH